MIILDKMYEKFFLVWKRVSENFIFLYSNQGKLSREQFFGALIILCLLHSLVGNVSCLICSYLSELVCLYFLFVIIQKRCRDFGSKGTFFILLASACAIFLISIHFLNVKYIARMWVNVGAGVIFMSFLAFFILFIIPSKPDADMNLRSPLLKYPLLYTAICWVLAIAATLAVNHYAGIEVF